MKVNHLTRQIRLKTSETETRKLEEFIEQICDEYHIYDAYYGNILAANTIAFEIISGSGEKYNEPFTDIYFNSSPTGLFFTMKIHGLFLEFASLYERVSKNMDKVGGELRTEERSMLMIKLLSDNIKLDPEGESITLVFNVTGINEPLSIQRIELLEKYYSKLLEKEKAR